MAERPITEDVLPSLREWFEYNCSTGCSPAQLKETLVESGYRPKDVDRFVKTQSVLLAQRKSGDRFDADPVASTDEAIERFWRRLDVLGSFNQISLGDRTVRMLAKNPRYGIYFIADFLSDDECDGLIRDAGPRMAESEIVDENSGAVLKTSSRSSRGGVIDRGETDLARRIESRIAKLTALPTAHGEGLQILQYGLGAEYRPHVDYFDPATIGGARVLAKNSQRMASLIMYLSDVETGGGTQFPQLSLEFTPMKGAALLFASIGRDGALLETSLHAGGPVTSGEKWIATKWIRLTPQDLRGGKL